MPTPPGRDMPSENWENVLNAAIEREPVPLSSIFLVQSKSTESLAQEMSIHHTEGSSLQLCMVKQIRLRLDQMTENTAPNNPEILTLDQTADQIRSRLLLPADSSIDPLDWNTQSHQSTNYLVRLPVAQQWDWRDKNIQTSGPRIVASLNVHTLKGDDENQYPDECLKQIRLTEQARQLAVVRWLLTIYHTRFKLARSEADQIFSDFQEAIFDEQPLNQTTKQYNQLCTKYKVTNGEFLHAVRLATIEEELQGVAKVSRSELEQRLGMLAALPDLRSEDIHWVAPRFPQLKDFLLTMGIATEKKYPTGGQEFLHQQFEPAISITAELDQEKPADRATAEQLLLSKFGIKDFEACKDLYQEFKDHLIDQIEQIFRLGGLADEFNADQLRIDKVLDQPSMVDPITFVQKVIGVYETASSSAKTPAERQQADRMRFEARRMASCLESLSSLLERHQGYRKFAVDLTEVSKQLGYDPKNEHRTLLRIGTDATGEAITVPVNMHVRPEKSRATTAEKAFRDGFPSDVSKDTDFYARAIEVLIPQDDPRLATIVAPDDMVFWDMDSTGKLIPASSAQNPSDHAIVFDIIRSHVEKAKVQFAKTKPEIRIVKYRATGSFQGRHEGSMVGGFPGMGRYVLHIKTTVPTWQYTKGQKCMEETQLFFPTEHRTAPENHEVKKKDEQAESGLSYQLRRIMRLALLFFPPRFNTQMLLLERAYEQAKKRLH